MAALLSASDSSSFLRGSLQIRVHVHHRMMPCFYAYNCQMPIWLSGAVRFLGSLLAILLEVIQATLCWAGPLLGIGSGSRYHHQIPPSAKLSHLSCHPGNPSCSTQNPCKNCRSNLTSRWHCVATSDQQGAGGPAAWAYLPLCTCLMTLLRHQSQVVCSYHWHWGALDWSLNLLTVLWA